MNKLKPGDWIHAVSPGGGIVQGRVARVVLDSKRPHVALPDGTLVPLAWIKQRLGPMTRDDDGTMRQNPGKREVLAQDLPEYDRKRAELRRYMVAWTGPEGVDALIRTYHPVDIDNELDFYRKKGMPMATKRPSPAQLAARKKFAAMAKAGAFKRKRNPLTRVKRNSPSMATGEPPSPRLRKRRAKTSRAPAGYYANPLTRVKVGSKSMATGKAPSKRLKARRTKTAKAPRGYYANPAPVGYAVSCAKRGGASFSHVATFKGKAEAVQYAKALHAAHPGWAVKVTGKAR